MRSQASVDGSAESFLAHSTGAGGSDLVITVPADPDQFWVVDWIMVSYAAAPTAGKVTVSINGVEYINHHITAGGLTLVDLNCPLVPNECASGALVVTLANGAQAKAITVRYR